MHHTHKEAAQRSAVVAATAPAVGVEVQTVLEPAIVLVVEVESVHVARVGEKRSQRYEPARLPE